MLLEPIISPMVSILCLYKSCHGCRTKRIKKVLQDGEERLEKHLEITKLIKKVQHSHDILKSFY